MSASRLAPPLQWRVELAAHDLPPRWRVPARTARLPAVSAESACLRVIRWAHSDIGAPPWRPCTRLSMRFATAKRCGEGSHNVSDLPCKPLPAQPSLFDLAA